LSETFLFLSFVFQSSSLRGARYTSYLALSWSSLIKQRSETKTALATPTPATLGLKEDFFSKELFKNELRNYPKESKYGCTY
jgi:hypothetical protein